MKTYTPNDIAAMSTSDFAKLTNDELSSLSVSCCSVISVAQIQSLSNTQFAIFNANQLAALNKEALLGISAGQISKLSNTQIYAFANFNLLAPDAFRGLSASQVPYVRSGAGGFDSWSRMSGTQIGALSPAAFAALTNDQLDRLSTEAMKAVTASQIAQLSNSQIASIKHFDLYSAAAFSGLTAAQVPYVFSDGIGPEAWYLVRSSQIAAMSPEAFASMTNVQLSSISTTEYSGITSNQIARLNNSQISAFNSFDLLPPAAFAGLMASQVASIRTNGQIGNSWQNVSASQIAAMNTAAFAALSTTQLNSITQAALQGLTSSHIAQWSASQFTAFNHFEWLPPAAFAALTPSLVATIKIAGGPAGGSWANVSASQIAALSPSAFAALNNSQIASISQVALQCITSSHVAQWSASQFAAFNNFEWLPPVAFAALTPSLVANIKIGGASAGGSWANVSASQIAALSPASFVALTNNQISSITRAALQGVTADQISLLNYKQFESLQNFDWLPPAAFAGLTAAQIPYVVTHNTQRSGWGEMTAEQIAALSASAFAALTNYQISTLSQAGVQGVTANQIYLLNLQQIASFNHFEWLSPAAFAGLSAAQVPYVVTDGKGKRGGSWSSMTAAQIAALSPAAFAALSNSQVSSISWSGLQGMTANQISLLNNQQIASLDHFDWLPPAAYAGLTPSQMSYVETGAKRGGSWSSMTAAQITALSPAAFAALSNSQISSISWGGLQGVTANQISLLNNQQIASLDHFDWLPPAAYAGLTPSQMSYVETGAKRGGSWSWMSASQIAAMSPAAFSILSNSQLSSISQAGLQGVTANQISLLNNQQIASLNYFDWLPPAAFAGLTSAQMPFVKTAGKAGNSWSYMNAAQIAALSPSAFAALSSTQLSSITQSAFQGAQGSQIAVLSNAQISMLRFDWFSPSACSGLSASQVPYLRSGYCGTYLWNSLSTQIAAMSPAAFAAFSNSQISSIGIEAGTGITANQISALSNAQISAITNFQFLNAGAFSGLSAGQVTYIAMDKVGWSWLVANQIAAITPSAFAALSSTQLAFLSYKAASGASAIQLNALSQSQFQALTGDFISGVTPTAFSGLDTFHLSYLTSSQAGGLTNEQLNASKVSGLGTNPLMIGTNGADIFEPSASATSLFGLSGNDTYLMKRGQGMDIIVDKDSTLGNTDIISLAADIATDQLWFRHEGNDLKISVIGTGDSFTVSNWYANTTNQIEQIKAANGKTLTNHSVEKLVAAMSSMSAPAAGTMTMPANYQTTLAPVLAANWK